MTKEQIEALISNWIEAELEEYEDARAMQTSAYDEDEREATYIALSNKFESLQEDLVSNDLRSIATEADDLLKLAGLTLGKDSAEFRQVCRRLLRAKIEVLRVEADRLEGEYRDNHLARAASISSGNEKISLGQKQTPLFSIVLEKYLATNPRPARTAQPLKAEFLRFIETIGGDKPVATITKADGVAYKESLQLVRKIHLTTCIKHISNVDTLFKWAEVHGYLPEGSSSPMKGLAPSKRQAKKHALDRRPFTDSELLMIFGSTEFKRQRTERPERYWLVLLLLFQGCRREEAGQLYVKNLGEAEGIPYLHIIDEEKDQTLKNEGSRRKVPLHTSLIKLGFMGYVSSIKKAGHVRLFPQLARKGNNGYADPVGKWFGRMVTDLGLTDPRLVIHSLRHGGITKLHSAGVPVNIVETLVGHSAGNVHDQYVHKELISMKTLRKGLEKMQYPELVKCLVESK